MIIITRYYNFRIEYICIVIICALCYSVLEFKLFITAGGSRPKD